MSSRLELFIKILPQAHIQETLTGRVDALVELDIADLHLASSISIAEVDPIGAYQLCYDSARKSIQALLMADGLRITSQGGHFAFVRIAESGFSPEHEWNHFRIMRQLRNMVEYPEVSSPSIAMSDLAEAHAAAKVMSTTVRKLLNE